MSRYTDPIHIHVNGSFYIMLAIGVLTVPIQWLLAWLISATVHELGHLICLKICGIAVENVEVSGFGAKIRTPPIGNREWLCALAGPCAGLILLPFAQWIPKVAVCAAVHCVFNLLPVYPLDGGRFLRSVLSYLLPKNDAVIISKVFGILTVAGGIFLILSIPDAGFRNILLVALFTVILVKLPIKIPCKQGN